MSSKHKYRTGLPPRRTLATNPKNKYQTKGERQLLAARVDAAMDRYRPPLSPYSYGKHTENMTNSEKVKFALKHRRRLFGKKRSESSE